MTDNKQLPTQNETTNNDSRHDTEHSCESGKNQGATASFDANFSREEKTSGVAQSDKSPVKSDQDSNSQERNTEAGRKYKQPVPPQGWDETHLNDMSSGPSTKGPLIPEGPVQAVLPFIAGLLFGLIGFLLVLFLSLGNNAPYRNRMLRFCAFGVILGAVIDLIIFSVAGETMASSMMSLFPQFGQHTSSSAF